LAHVSRTQTKPKSVAGRIAARRSLRLVGRKLDPQALKHASVLEGPELVGAVTAVPERSARAEPIRQRLMDAAELLFARWGYTGVSVRDVTELAGTRLADVTYYFGSKQNLYFEVLKRRATPLGEARVTALRACDARRLKGRAYLEAWVDAYLDPPLQLLACGEPGWDYYLRLIAQVAYSRLWPDTFTSYYNVTAEEFMASLAARFPQASAALIQHCFLMLTATTMYTLARTGRAETFAKPAFRSSDMDILGPLTRDFVVLALGGLLMAKAR
jgi:AcrR family transcriptional regulator